jgi:hypothetical protein
LLTVQTAVRATNGLPCKPCGIGPAPSKLEAAAYAALGSDALVTECKLLGGNYGAADIFVRSCNTIVMVDGEHHYHASHHGKQSSKQVEVDIRFTKAAVEMGYSVVRVAPHEVADVHKLVRSVAAEAAATRQPCVILSHIICEAYRIQPEAVYTGEHVAVMTLAL